MKKIIGLVLAIMMLSVSFALAEDLSAMTDKELKTLILDAFEELQSRGLNYDPETAVSVFMDEALSDRVLEFYSCWSANDLDHMLDVCDPAWKALQENPKTALFTLLENRTPLSLIIESFHEEADGTRSAVVVACIDRHDGNDPRDYRCTVVLKKAEDGQWYLDPLCLQTYEPAEGVSWETPAQEPAAYDWSADETLLYTLMYYVPEGGEYYHLDKNCRRVAEKYLPMRGVFTYQYLNYDEYRNLKPCDVCGAPPRDYAPTVLTGFFMKIYDHSGLENVSYLRADVYKDDRLQYFICSCPDAGEDFYRFFFDSDTVEDIKKMQIEFSYGISDLPPEEAILSVMSGTPGKEHKLLTQDIAAEGGKTYCLSLEADGKNGFTLVQAE